MDSLEKEALLGFLNSPKFVEASTNSSRFSNNKDKLVPLLDLLYHGSIYLLKYQEFISGQDTALLLLEVAAKCLQQRQDDATSPQQKENIKSLVANPSLTNHMTNNTLDMSVCQKVASLAVGLPDGEHGRVRFIAETLKTLSPKLLNRDLLHNAIANVFWQAKDYPNARYHFLHCANLENARDVAALLVEYQSKNALKSEVDLFITQFILQLLCLQCPLDSPGSSTTTRQSNRKQPTTTTVTPPNATVSKKTRATIKSIASQIFSAYTLKHPDLGQVDVPFSLPLLNFTHFIMNILDSSQAEQTAYQMLCDIYRVSWNRDPNYQNYLNRIGTMYFGIVDIARQQQHQQQQRGGGGLLNNILMSLLDGPDDEDGDDESLHEGNTTNTTSNMSPCDELD